MTIIAPCPTCSDKLQRLCVYFGLPLASAKGIDDPEEATFTGWLFASVLSDCETCREQLPPELLNELAELKAQAAKTVRREQN